MRGRRQNRPKQNPRRESPSSLQVSGVFRTPKVAIQKFERTTVQAFTLVPSTGILATAFDMEIAFSLNSTYFSLGGTVISVDANPGASEFVALYDEYRISEVEVSFMYGANAVAPGTAASPQLPILDIAFDPSDASVTSLSTILQYQNLVTVQLGNQRTANGFVVRCRPVPDLSAGTGGAAVGAIIPQSAPWLSTDFPTVQHNCLKVFYDSAGSTSTAVIGTLTMYVKYHFEMKLSH
jgi:hypothetical protein